MKCSKSKGHNAAGDGGLLGGARNKQDTKMLDWLGYMDESDISMTGKKLGRGPDYGGTNGVPRTLAHKVEGVCRKHQRLHGLRHLVSQDLQPLCTRSIPVKTF